jgi:tetratricopeptide (TPR) repeat protein
MGMRNRTFRIAGLVLLAVFSATQLLMACVTIAPEAMTKGVEYVRSGRSQEAIAEFNKGLADGYNNRGEAYQISGRWNEAMADFDKATTLNPQDSRPYQGRAQYYISVGKLDEAIEQANASVATNDPYSWWALPMRSRLYHIRGEVEFALKDYNVLVQGQPQNYVYLTQRGFAYYELGDQEKALADFNNALTINPKLLHAYFGRSLVNAAKGEDALAQGDLEKVRHMDATFAESYVNEAKDMKRLGLLPRAQRLLKYAFIINPDLKNRYKDFAAEINSAQAHK